MREDVESKKLTVVDKLAKDLIKYAELQMEYQRVNSSEKIAAATSFIVSVVIVAVILLFCFIFVIVSIAVVLSYYTSWVIGFGLLAVTCLVLAILALVFRKQLIERPMYDLAAGAILDSIDLDNDEDDKK